MTTTTTTTISGYDNYPINIGYHFMCPEYSQLAATWIYVIHFEWRNAHEKNKIKKKPNGFVDVRMCKFVGIIFVYIFSIFHKQNNMYSAFMWNMNLHSLFTKLCKCFCFLFRTTNRAAMHSVRFASWFLWLKQMVWNHRSDVTNDVWVLNQALSTNRNFNGFDHTTFDLDKSDIKSIFYSFSFLFTKNPK